MDAARPPRPVRLVAVDLDGTLVQRDRTVTPRARAALAACAERGIPVAVVSARRWSAAEPLLRDLDVHGHAVVVGGAVVREVATGRVVVERRMRPDVVAAVVDAIEACGLQPLVAVDHGERHLAGDPRRDSPSARRYTTLRGGAAQRVGATALRGAAATRVLAMGAASRVLAARRRCVGLPCRLVVQPCIIPAGDRGEPALELHAAAADKGTALRDLCRSLGIHAGEALAVGDAPSDLPMLEAAGIGVLMGDADAAMRRPGIVVGPRADEDGAAWAVETFVLERPGPRRRRRGASRS